MAIMHEFALHNCHKADDDLLLTCETLDLRYNPLIRFRNYKSFVVELWWRNSVSL
jgi:hypothetical protein